MPPVASWWGLSALNKMRINALPSGKGKMGEWQTSMLFVNYEFLGASQCFFLASRTLQTLHTEGAW